MNTREMASQYRITKWTQVLQERIANKENVNDFCKRLGISKNTYFYWQRKLREKACKELLPLAQAKKPEISAAPKGWAVCELEEVEPTEKSVTIEIGKCKVSADSVTDIITLEKVCRMLVSLC